MRIIVTNGVWPEYNGKVYEVIEETKDRYVVKMHTGIQGVFYKDEVEEFPDGVLFGDLSTEEQLDLMKHWFLGGKIEYGYDGVKYGSIDGPSWNKGVYYRKAAMRKPSIDWDVIRPEYRWITQDVAGNCWVHVDRPTFYEAGGFWDSDGESMCVNGLVSLTKGDIEAKNTLDER